MKQQELIDKVLEQIKHDVLQGDITCIEELITNISTDKLTAFLSDSEYKG